MRVGSATLSNFLSPTEFQDGSSLTCYYVTGGGTMTATEVCFLIWAIVGVIVVAILLRVGERTDEPGREDRA
jgi:hypothetical protein